LSPGERLGRLDSGRWAGQYGAFLGNRFGNTGRCIPDFLLFTFTLGFIARVNREKTKRIACNSGDGSNNPGRNASRRGDSTRDSTTTTPDNLPFTGASSFAFAFFALRIATGFFGAVAGSVSSNTTHETFLRQKCRARDFSARAGLVFHEVVGIVGDRKTGIVANLAEWCIGGTDPSIGEPAIGNRSGGNRNTGGSLGIWVRTTK
jgi:hypothetical protein